MAVLTSHKINKKQLKDDLVEFKKLLNDPNKPELDELKDIQNLYKSRPDLCAFMGMYNPYIIDKKNLVTACEFSIFGDHKADLVIGDTANHAYSFIEFEDAKEESIFKKSGKLTPEWSTRYEHGFSQLVDWILWLEDSKGTTAFQGRFGSKSIRYNVLLVIGRDKYLTPALQERMDWRSDHVVIHSKQFNCITLDKLYLDLTERIKGF